jgi:hypothetical protein
MDSLFLRIKKEQLTLLVVNSCLDSFNEVLDTFLKKIVSLLVITFQEFTIYQTEIHIQKIKN